MELITPWLGVILFLVALYFVVKWVKREKPGQEPAWPPAVDSPGDYPENGGGQVHPQDTGGGAGPRQNP